LFAIIAACLSLRGRLLNRVVELSSAVLSLFTAGMNFFVFSVSSHILEGRSGLLFNEEFWAVQYWLLRWAGIVVPQKHHSWGVLAALASVIPFVGGKMAD